MYKQRWLLEYVRMHQICCRNFCNQYPLDSSEWGCFCSMCIDFCRPISEEWGSCRNKILQYILLRVNKPFNSVYGVDKTVVLHFWSVVTSMQISNHSPHPYWCRSTLFQRYKDRVLEDYIHQDRKWDVKRKDRLGKERSLLYKWPSKDMAFTHTYA